MTGQNELPTLPAMNIISRLLLGLSLLLSLFSLPAEDKKSDAESFIGWLLQEDRDLTGVPFADVVKATSGKKVLPLDAGSSADRELLEKLGRALDEVLNRMNQPDSPAQKQKRINEVSSHFENEIRRVLDAHPDFSCDYPKLKSGKVQRSGYPDLRLVDKKNGRVIYIDPKLFEAGNRTSTLRTFYFEPNADPNKILEDAHHMLIGIEHGGKQGDLWKFQHWELVDLSKFRVRLKAEFQGSNRDLYRPEAIVGTSRK